MPLYMATHTVEVVTAKVQLTAIMLGDFGLPGHLLRLNADPVSSNRMSGLTRSECTAAFVAATTWHCTAAGPNLWGCVNQPMGLAKF
jgi:hypothetical protein